MTLQYFAVNESFIKTLHSMMDVAKLRPDDQVGHPIMLTVGAPTIISFRPQR